MKTSSPRSPVAAPRRAVAGSTRGRASQGADALAASPLLAAQRRRIDQLTGTTAQLQAPEEELQMKAAHAVAQRAALDEEVPMQGRFEAPLQRMEEEELMQGRFAPVQRVEEDELLQGRFEPVQRVDEEELLQGRFTAVQRQEEAGAAAPNRTGLPDGLKAGVESLSGMSMDNVRVHYGSDRPAQLNALAYAQGNDIHVAPGQEKHLPHEAWHVVQQAQGRVRPTMQMQGGTPVNDDTALESEADAMGAQALRMPPASSAG